MIEDMQRIGASFAASPRQIAGPDLPPPLHKRQADEQVERLIAGDVIIGGSPKTCARRIADSAEELGLTAFLANSYLSGVGQERVERTLRLFGERVVQRVGEVLKGGASSVIRGAEE